MHFINIDGPNKVGKSTFIKSLVQKLEETTSLKIYTQHFHRRETLIGQTIQQVLNGEVKLDNLALQQLYCADRLDFTNVKYKQLEQEGYDLLITDRYHTSGLAYGFMSGLDTSILQEFDKYCVKPDVNIILMADYETLKNRTQVLNDGETGDIHEDESKIGRVLAGYCMVSTIVDRCIDLNVSKGSSNCVPFVADLCEGVCENGTDTFYLYESFIDKYLK